MPELDIGELGNGNILVTVPHMDDAVLGCGGTLLKLPHKERIHLVYCTDGRGILNNPKKAAGYVSGEENIGEVRRRETEDALRTLGIPLENVSFLTFPELGVPQRIDALRKQLEELLRKVEPEVVLTPFRYDRHPDHVALSHTVEGLAAEGEFTFRMLQYFVYFQWKLLPRKDIRSYLRPEHILVSDLSGISNRKHQALSCFTSQTTCFFPWQHKPVLSEALLALFSEGPEVFLATEPGISDRSIFRIPPFLVHAIHYVEPRLKIWKENTKSCLHRLLPRH